MLDYNTKHSNFIVKGESRIEMFSALNKMNLTQRMKNDSSARDVISTAHCHTRDFNKNPEGSNAKDS